MGKRMAQSIEVPHCKLLRVSKDLNKMLLKPRNMKKLFDGCCMIHASTWQETSPANRTSVSCCLKPPCIERVDFAMYVTDSEGHASGLIIEPGNRLQSRVADTF